MTWIAYLKNLIPPDVQLEMHIINWHKQVPQYYKFELPKDIGLNNFFKKNDYFVFSFVRHPFDRYVFI